MDEIITILRQRLDVPLRRRFADRPANVGQCAPLARNILGLLLTPFLVASMLVFCAGIALVSEHAEAAGATYTVTQEGVLPSTGTTRVVRAANDSGEIVGTDDENGRGHRGFFKGSGGRQEIGDLPKESDYSTVFGINNLGQVVGSVNINTGMRAFRSQRAAGGVVLNTLPGDTSSAALAINNQGKAVGWSSGAKVRAVAWSPAGAIQALPMLPDSNSCRGLAINDRGLVAGECNTASGPHAVLWTGGTVQDLGTLPGDTESTVSGINNNGDIVGSSGNLEVQHHAVLWPKGGAIQDLGVLPNKTSSKALSVNDRGEVVGVSVTEGQGGEHAFLWTQRDGMQDLNDLVAPNADFVLSHAIAISSQGLIVATGHDVSTQDEITQPVGHAHEGHELPLRIFRLRLDGGL